MRPSQNFSSLNYLNTWPPTENGRTTHSLLYDIAYDLDLFIYAWDGSRPCIKTWALFGTRLKFLERLLGALPLMSGRSCILWSFAASSWLMSLERRRRRCQVQNWVIPEAPGSGRFLPPVGWADPSLPSAPSRLPSVARCVCWPTGRALTRLAGRPGRSLAGPLRHPSAAGKRRPWRRPVGERAARRAARRKGGCARGRGRRAARNSARSRKEGERCWGCRLGSVEWGCWVLDGCRHPQIVGVGSLRPYSLSPFSQLRAPDVRPPLLWGPPTESSLWEPLWVAGGLWNKALWFVGMKCHVLAYLGQGNWGRVVDVTFPYESDRSLNAL